MSRETEVKKDKALSITMDTPVEVFTAHYKDTGEKVEDSKIRSYDVYYDNDFQQAFPTLEDALHHAKMIHMAKYEIHPDLKDD